MKSAKCYDCENNNFIIIPTREHFSNSGWSSKVVCSKCKKGFNFQKYSEELGRKEEAEELGRKEEAEE